MKTAIAIAVCAALAACVPAGLEDVRDGLPQPSDATVPLPGSAGEGELASAEQPLLGQQAELYRVTRDATNGVNGGVVWVLGLVRTIASLPPTSSDGDTYTWGPSEPKNLEPKNNWKLVATRNDDGSVTYALSAKKTSEGDDAWRSIVSGTHEKGAARRTGRGTLRLDFDASHELNDPSEDVGLADVTYGWHAGEGYRIDAQFTQVRDRETGGRIDATYAFEQADGGPGTFDFTTFKDLHGDDGVLETLDIRSRWEESGTGRSDVRASGGTLAAEATISECWDTNFGRTFLEVSFDPSQNEGDAASCAFATRELPAR